MLDRELEDNVVVVPPMVMKAVQQIHENAGAYSLIPNNSLSNLQVMSRCTENEARMSKENHELGSSRQRMRSSLPRLEPPWS